MGISNRLSIVLPPAMLAILELFHATGHQDAVYESLTGQVDRWLVVHFLQLLLFPMTALSVYRLTAGKSGWMPIVCALAMSVFGIGYAAFDSIAGIGTGILIVNTNEFLEIMAESPDAPQEFELIASEMIQSFYHSPFATNIVRIAVLAAIVGFILTGTQIYQDTGRWFPLLMLAGASWGVTKTHAPPYGPITYSFVFLALAFAVFSKPTKTSAAADSGTAET